MDIKLNQNIVPVVSNKNLESTKLPVTKYINSEEYSSDGKLPIYSSNTANIIVTNNSIHNSTHPYINKKITKLDQQQRSYNLKPVFSYESKGSSVNLNGKVSAFSNESPSYIAIANTRNEVPRVVVCRHFSWAYINTDKKQADFLTSVNSKEKLEKHPDFLIDKFKYYNPKNAKLAYYFSLDQLPIVIKQLIIETFFKQNKQEERFLLHSSSHAMAIQIKKKDDDVFVIYFYDPNKTNIHTKFIITNLEESDKLTADNIFTNTKLNNYFAEEIPAACILHKDTKNKESSDIQVFGTMSSSLSYLIMFNEHFGETTIQDLINDENNDTSTKVKTLQAKSNKGNPGLHMMLAKNDTENIQVLIENILNSNLTCQNKIELLQAKNEEGKPGIYSAFMINNAEAIEVFTLAILNSDLDHEDKISLLMAFNAQGISGIDIALFKNHKESIDVFNKIIKNSVLIKDEDKQKLLYSINCQQKPLVISKEFIRK